MTTVKQSKTRRKAPTKTKQAKSKASVKKRPAKTKAAPAGKDAVKAKSTTRTDTMAQLMDALVLRETDAERLKAALSSESARRGVKNPGLGGLRSHVKYRQARGQLTAVNITW